MVSPEPRREQGIRLSVVGNDDTRRYHSRMDVFQTLDIPFTENFERHNEAGRFVPIKRIEGDSCKPAVDAVCDRILRHSDCSSYHGAGAKKRQNSSCVIAAIVYIGIHKERRNGTIAA